MFQTADAYVLLVSEAFLKSEYVTTKEWVWIQEAMKGRPVCWIPLGKIDQRSIPRCDAKARGITDLEFIADGEVTSVFRPKGGTFGRAFAVKVAKNDSFDGLSLSTIRHAQNFAGIPNFIPIYEVDSTSRPFHCVREFVTGHSLSRLIADHNRLRRDIPADLVHRVVYRLALALESASKRGHAHLNIKPSNIMVDKNGEPFLSPTGRDAFSPDEINQVVDSLRGKSRAAGRTALIEETLAYSPPDPLHNPNRSDQAVDVFALGLMGYHMITRTLPPTVANLDELLERKATEPEFRKPLPLDRDHYPLSLLATINRMVALDEADRYATPAEIVQALDYTPPAELAKVERSWVRCRGKLGQTLYKRFHDVFFRLAPGAKQLFPVGAPWPMQRQKDLLDSAILRLMHYHSLWIRFRNVPAELNPLTGQARSHADRRIHYPLFKLFGIALIETLGAVDDSIRDEFLDDDRLRAWADVLRPGIDYLTREVRRLEEVPMGVETALVIPAAAPAAAGGKARRSKPGGRTAKRKKTNPKK